MENVLTKDNILFVITIGSIIFAAFSYFHVPQEAMEKRQAVIDEKIKNKASTTEQKDIDKKAELLASQVQWEKEANERRFKEMGDAMTAALTLAQNHIHTIDTKVDTLASSVNSMNLSITKELAQLSTTIKVCFKDKIV